MPHLVKWQQELGPFGLIIVGPHVQGGSNDAVVAKAKSLGVNFTVTKGGGIEGGGGGGIPHSFIFDHTGTMVFEGHPSEAEPKLKSSLGKAIVESLEKTPKSKQVVALCQALSKGQPPLGIMQKAVPLLRGSDMETVEEAKILIAALTKPGQKKLEDAEALMQDDPVAAYNMLEKMPADYKGTPVGAKAAEMVAALKKEKVVDDELKARPMLETIKRTDVFLTNNAKAAKVSVTDDKFQKFAAGHIKMIKDTLTKMKKAYPDAKATAEATTIADKFGIIIP